MVPQVLLRYCLICDHELRGGVPEIAPCVTAAPVRFDIARTSMRPSFALLGALVLPSYSLFTPVLLNVGVSVAAVMVTAAVLAFRGGRW